MSLKIIRPNINLLNTETILTLAPNYIDGISGEEDKLRSCYRDNLELAHSKSFKSIAFPLVSTGSQGLPKEEVLRIAADEINMFLTNYDMDVFLVVDYEDNGKNEILNSQLEDYIYSRLVEKNSAIDYNSVFMSPSSAAPESPKKEKRKFSLRGNKLFGGGNARKAEPMIMPAPCLQEEKQEEIQEDYCAVAEVEELSKKLDERLAHRSDTFSEYFMYLIDLKGLKNSDVYKNAIVDKRYFSKIKNNKDFHPDKLKALCLCVGAKLSLDETKDLLARAGYALSPADLTDIIFSFYIENKHYDVIDIDIQLEEHGLPCIIE